MQHQEETTCSHCNAPVGDVHELKSSRAICDACAAAVQVMPRASSSTTAATPKR